MTTPPAATSQPARTLAERALACIVWITVLGTAAVEVMLLTPMVPKAHVPLADMAQFYASGSLFQILWIWCLGSERAHRHNRRRTRFLRRLGSTVQVLFLTFLALGTWPTKGFVCTAEGSFFVVLAMTLWHARAATEALHPDDQKIVDQVIEEEERLLSARLQEEAKRIREARLNDALAQVRRYTMASPTPSVEPDPTPAIRWDVRKGQHAPVVYFIRNGNRIKIGTTTDLYQRIRRLALRADDVVLLLPGSREVERDMHRRFTSLRVGNTEWFRDAPPLSNFITGQTERLTEGE